jgi:hypothetical protein
MEPQLTSKFGDYLASYLKAGFATKLLANTYNVFAKLFKVGPVTRWKTHTSWDRGESSVPASARHCARRAAGLTLEKCMVLLL